MDDSSKSAAYADVKQIDPHTRGSEPQNRLRGSRRCALRDLPNTEPAFAGLKARIANNDLANFNNVKVVPGRGPVGTKRDLIEYREVMMRLRERITQLIKDGMTLEQAIAAKPTKDFDARWANGPIRPDQLVKEVYFDLKRKVR